MLQGKLSKAGLISTGSSRPILAVGAVLLGSFIANFHGRIFSIGLPDIRGALSLSFDEGSWLSTSVTAPQILIAPAVAWLATVFGLRRVLIGPGLLYALVSLLIPFARNYGSLLTLSIIHALLLGTFVPATMMIIFRGLSARWWLLAIAIYCVRVGYAQNVGVWTVGFYMDHFGWQWLYWQDIVLALLMAWLVYLGCPDQPVNRALLANADWGGMLLFGTGLAMIFAGLDQGNRLDWLGSGIVTSLLLAGALLLAGFFLNELLVRDAWASADVLLSRNVGLALIVLILFALTSVSNSSLVPNFLAGVAQLRPEQIGPVMLACATVPMLALLPLAIYLLKKADARFAAILGLTSFALAGLLGTRLTHDWSRGDFIPIVVLQGIGYAFTLFSLIVIVLSNSDPARATAFAAYVQVLRLGSAEIGTALMSTWLRVREQVHSNWLGRSVENGDAVVASVLNQLSARFADHGASLAPERSLGMLAKLVQREANVLAYIDGFWLTFAAAIFALLLLAFIGPPPAGPLTRGAADD
jgi:DHA2 family multidrug resistance protein